MRCWWFWIDTPIKMNIFIPRRGLRPGSLVVSKFAKSFQKNKQFFLRYLMYTKKDVLITSYICGSVLYLDLIYDSITHGPYHHVELTLEIENNHLRSVYTVQNLFSVIVQDAVTPNDSLFLQLGLVMLD